MGSAEVILYAVAALALLWIGIPAVAFAVHGPIVRANPRQDPAAAEPRGDDPDYARRYQQFSELGFRPAGTTFETCWFRDPSEWYWRTFQGIRWMASSDGKTLVTFHRHTAEEPVRFGAVTVFEGDGCVRTASPGGGAGSQTERYMRLEVGQVEPAELIKRHELHVMTFSMHGGRQPRAATLDEAAAIEIAQETSMMKAAGRGGYALLLCIFALPALVGWKLANGPSPLRWAIGVCVGAAVFAAWTFVIWPAIRRAEIRHDNPAGGRKRRDDDMMSRSEAAKQLLRDQRYAEATDEYVWLWNNIARVDPNMSGVRLSFMAGEIEKLVAAHADARERFAALRDAAAVAAERRAGSPEAREDWVVLNTILGDDERTLAWFESVKDDPAAAAEVALVARRLIELLKERGRWAEAGRLYTDPLAELALQHSALAGATNPLFAEKFGDGFAVMRDVMSKQFRDGASALVISLRAAGRSEDAAAVVAEALRLDPSDEMRRTLDPGAPN